MEGADEKLLSRMIRRTEDPDTGHLLKQEDFLTLFQTGDTLTQTLLKVKPKTILALGDEAFSRLTGQWGIPTLRGYVFPTRFGPVVGSYSPDYIRKGKLPLADVFRRDLRRALSTARHGIPTFPKHYTLNPTLKEAYAFLESYRLANRPPLAFDIETPWSKMEKDSTLGDPSVEDDASYTILRISFAYAAGRAITMPWTNPYIGVARALLSDPGDKLVWNQHFDVPRLAAAGSTFGGPILDGMDAWHFLEPSLPMGLKYVATFFCPDMHAWKLESKSQPEWYSCADSDVLWRVFAGIRESLQKAGRWDIFQKHFVDLSGVLRGMSARGVLVDPVLREARFNAYEEEYRDLKASMQDLVPMDIKPKKVYKKPLEWLQTKGVWTKENSTNFITLTSMEWQRKKKPKKEKPVKPPKPPKPEKREKSVRASTLPRKGRQKKLPATIVELPPPLCISSPDSPDQST